MKLKKFHCFTSKMSYLEHTVTHYKLSIRETQTKVIKDPKYQQNFTKLRSFLVYVASTNNFPLISSTLRTH